jgi:hypothetical protein
LAIGGLPLVATHILGRNHTVLIPDRVDSGAQHVEGAGSELHEHEGSAVRGLFFAMVFNVLLVLAGVVVWQVWRILR